METIWARVIASQKLSRDNGETIFAAKHQNVSQGLSGPVSRDTAILSLRYPISRDTFKGRSHSPKMVRYPPWVLSFTQAHLCDTPFCNVSRDNCAIPQEKKTSTRAFCDTIAARIARYGKYRCWASKHRAQLP